MTQERIWKRLYILATMYISVSFRNLFIDLRFQVVSIHGKSWFEFLLALFFSQYLFLVD